MEEQSILECGKWYLARRRYSPAGAGFPVRICLTVSGKLYIADDYNKKSSITVHVNSVYGDMEQLCVKGRPDHYDPKSKIFFKGHSVGPSEDFSSYYFFNIRPM